MFLRPLQPPVMAHFAMEICAPGQGCRDFSCISFWQLFMTPQPSTKILRRFVHPYVELLEDRCVLSVVNFAVEPVVPTISWSTKAHLEAVFNLGLQLGNRPDVFAKVGDSITHLPYFLNDLGSVFYNPYDPNVAGAYTSLASTVLYFRAQPLDGTVNMVPYTVEAAQQLPQMNGVNSFNRNSLAAQGGWLTENLVDPAEGFPIGSELAVIKPSFALIMIGTNDSAIDFNAGVTPDGYQARLTEIANYCLSQGVIPILSTLPDVTFFGGTLEAHTMLYNQIISEVASSLDVPLWNYWLAMQPLPYWGLTSDGVHPDTSPLGSANFTSIGLVGGFNVRNLTALEVLQKMEQVIIFNGPADGPPPPLTPQTLQNVTSLYDTILGRKPDQTGLNSWGQLLQNYGLPAQQLAQDLWDSAEHRAQQVNQYYSSYLHRTPAPTEQGYWVGVFEGGASETQVQQAILSSGEYQAAHTSDSDFLTGLYHDVLGRSPDSPGEAALEQVMQGGQGRPAVIFLVLTSAENIKNEVDGFYSTFLNRTPVASEEQFWIAVAEQNGFSTELVAEKILSSTEFFATAH
jgi:lysophospholipase L1-like esterase